MEIKRILRLPKRSFLLLGPRGTGKSTLIRQQIRFDLEINLLEAEIFLPLSANPSELKHRTRLLKPGAWIYIDEVQKVPALMDEVHSLYESHRFNFAISGSSARKLKREGANLLAGRALSTSLFPFLYAEYQSLCTLDEAVAWGSLPQAVTEKQYRKDYLFSYVETYLRQELVEEGIVRKLEPFLRVLRVVGIYNGQVLNLENIARESHVGRSTVEKYFEILEDTLLGFRLPAFRAKWNRKEMTHPKFYLFDSGVARACAGLLSDETDPAAYAFSFETLILGEIRAYNSYLKLNRELFYYNYSGGYEVDVLIENRKKTISAKSQMTAIEIKASKTWDKRWNEALIDLQQKSGGRVKQLVGIYRGERRLQFGQVDVYPAEEFLEKLSQGEFLN